MRTCLTIALLIISRTLAFSGDPRDTVVRTFYPNKKLKAILTYRKVDNSLIGHGLNLEYFENGQVKDSCFLNMGNIVGKRNIYNKKGHLEGEIDYGTDLFPRTIVTTTYFRSGACRIAKREMTEKEPGVFDTNTIDKYYWKNGYIMDSVVMKNNSKLFRARFYEDGGIDFTEEYPINAKEGDEVVIRGYNKDGTTKYSRTEIKGKHGY